MGKFPVPDLLYAFFYLYQGQGIMSRQEISDAVFGDETVLKNLPESADPLTPCEVINRLYLSSSIPDELRVSTAQSIGIWLQDQREAVFAHNSM